MYTKDLERFIFHYYQLIILKDDLLLLPKDLARNLSNISRLVIVKRIGAGLHVVDPFTAEVPYPTLTIHNYLNALFCAEK